jgi:hypothetical protein
VREKITFRIFEVEGYKAAELIIPGSDRLPQMFLSAKGAAERYHQWVWRDYSRPAITHEYVSNLPKDHRNSEEWKKLMVRLQKIERNRIRRVTKVLQQKGLE